MNVAVFIGRFQPFHNAHFEIVKHALAKHDRLIVGIGSANQAPSPKNPFSAVERIVMISDSLPREVKVDFIRLRDYLYNDNQWIVEVQRKVREEVLYGNRVTIVGRMKDRTSAYVRQFPQWACDEYHDRHTQDATTVRKDMFECNWGAVREAVPGPVYEQLVKWSHTDEFRWVQEERKHYIEYAKQFTSPFPVVHSTTSAVVIQSGHVLLIRRKASPGKGLYAIPGGFIGQYETFEESMLRELKEETGLLGNLKEHIVAHRMFDHPDRSLRTRTIDQSFCIRLPDGDLAEVNGGDDADKAFWLPLADLYSFEDRFFEDHLHIIRYFTSRF